MRIVYRYSVGAGNNLTLPAAAFNPANVTLGVFYCVLDSTGKNVIVPTGGAGGVVKVQYALSLDPSLYQLGVPVWFDHPYLGDAEPVPKVGNIAFPVAAVRLSITTLPTAPAGAGFALMAMAAGQLG